MLKVHSMCYNAVADNFRVNADIIFIRLAVFASLISEIPRNSLKI